MSKYGEVACMAAEDARRGTSPECAWRRAAERVFPNQKSSREKSCPRCAFLGLAEQGLLLGIPPGEYIDSTATENKRYTIRALKLLQDKPRLCDAPSLLWRLVMESEADPDKSHNNQMDVVISLWKNGDIERHGGEG